MPKKINKPAVIMSAIALIIALLGIASYLLINKSANNKDSEIIVATYKNGKITLQDAEIEFNRLAIQTPDLANSTFSELSAKQREIIIQEALVKKITAQQAIKRNLDQEQEFKTTMEVFKNEMLHQKLLGKIAQEAQNTQNLQKKYQEVIAELKEKQDFRIRYISLATKKGANWLYKRLIKHPSSFAKYAKSKSLDEATAKNGGDLGFVIEDALPTEIKEAVTKVEKGQTAKPVKVGDRWVLARLEETRPAVILSYEEVEPKIRQLVAGEAVKKFIKDSLENAQLEIIDQ